jgi:hypothetical protein
MLVDGFCFGCRTLRGERSGDESVGHRLEPWRALSRCGSGASTRRPAYIGIKGQGKENRRPPRRETYRREHHAHGGASLRATDLRVISGNLRRTGLVLLHEKKRAKGKCINAGAIETPNGPAWIGDERFTKKIE